MTADAREEFISVKETVRIERWLLGWCATTAPLRHIPSLMGVTKDTSSAKKLCSSTYIHQSNLL